MIVNAFSKFLKNRDRTKLYKKTLILGDNDMISSEQKLDFILQNVAIINTLNTDEKLGILKGFYVTREWGTAKNKEVHFKDIQDLFATLLEKTSDLIKTQENFGVNEIKTEDIEVLKKLSDIWEKAIEENKGLNKLQKTYQFVRAKSNQISLNIKNVKEILIRINSLIGIIPHDVPLPDVKDGIIPIQDTYQEALLNKDKKSVLPDGLSFDAYCSEWRKTFVISKGYGEFDLNTLFLKERPECTCGSEYVKNIQNIFLQNCRYTYLGIDDTYNEVNGIDQKDCNMLIRNWSYLQITVEKKL